MYHQDAIFETEQECKDFLIGMKFYRDGEPSFFAWTNGKRRADIRFNAECYFVSFD